MKTYTATLVTKQYQTVQVTVPDEYTPEQIEIAICENGSLSDGEFENDVYDLEEVRDSLTNQQVQLNQTTQP